MIFGTNIPIAKSRRFGLNTESTSLPTRRQKLRATTIATGASAVAGVNHFHGDLR